MLPVVIAANEGPTMEDMKDDGTKYVLGIYIVMLYIIIVHRPQHQRRAPVVR